MTTATKAGERYVLRRKVLTLTGNSFHVYAGDGSLAAFCRQKAFRLKEDIRVYSDEDRQNELLTLRARSIIDFGATYDISLPTGERVGSIRRKGMKSTFVRDEWRVFDEQDREIARLREGGGWALARRWIDWIALLVPQRYELRTIEGDRLVATFRQRFNALVFTLGIEVHEEHEILDDLFVLAIACLLGAIEGRQG